MRWKPIASARSTQVARTSTRSRSIWPDCSPRSTRCCRGTAEAMSSIEAFVGHIRHELRTPVNAILGYSQLLLEEDDASLTVEERHDLERVTEAGHQLLRIVVEALDPAELIGDDVALCAVRLRHALHTPLTTVQGLVYLLIVEREGAPLCADLRRIDAAAVRLGQLSDSIEQLYRVRLGAAAAGP